MVNGRVDEPPSSKSDDGASPERATLAATVDEEEARLRRLEAEHAEAKARVDALRAKLAALDEAPTDHGKSSDAAATPPRSSTEKVRLTATPQRRDGHHPITEMQLGPVRFRVNAKSQANARSFEHRLIVRETAFRASASGETVGMQNLYAALARDEARNVLILNDVVRALEEGRSPILLTERKEHLAYFAKRLERVARHLVVLQGAARVVEGHPRAIHGSPPPAAPRETRGPHLRLC